MRVRLALQVGVMAAAALLVAWASAAVNNPIDSSVQPCQDDQDCDTGYTCTGGYCQKSVPADGGPDVPAAPKMLVSPTLLDFGNAYVGGEFTKTFTIGNIGAGTLTVTAMNLVEEPVGVFTVEQPSPVPFFVDPGATVTITVILRPIDATLPTGKIIIHSDDPDPSSESATVDLISRSKGSPDLGICAHEPGSSTCEETSPGNAVIDYGVVKYGDTAMHHVDLTNVGDGNLPIQIDSIYLTNPDHFTLALFELLEDPGNPGQYTEQAATLPFYLSIGDPSATPPVPPTRLRVHLAFTAMGVDGDIPAVSLMVKDATSPSPTSVPIDGTIDGCIPHVTDAGVLDGGSDPQTDPYNCGTCGYDCNANLGSHAASAKCQGGACLVDTCQGGWADSDGVFANGCECEAADTEADACGPAVLSVTPPAVLSGKNLVPRGDVDWYKVTFSLTGTCIKPSIALTSGDPAIVFDLVPTACGNAPVACTGAGESGDMTARRAWDVSYGTCGAKAAIDPNPLMTPPFWRPATPLVYYVKVYATGTPANCLPYELSVSQ